MIPPDIVPRGSAHPPPARCHIDVELTRASDWDRDGCRRCAIERFQEHLARYNQLCAIAERGTPTSEDMVFTAALRERDNPFPAVDYTEWAPRQGYAGSTRERIAAE